MNTLTANTRVIVKKADKKMEKPKNQEVDKEKLRRYNLHKACAPVGFSFKEPI